MMTCVNLTMRRSEFYAEDTPGIHLKVEIVSPLTCSKGNVLSAVNKQQRCSTVRPVLTQYAGVGEPPGFTVGGVGRMAVGLTRVVRARCRKERERKKNFIKHSRPDKTH